MTPGEFAVAWAEPLYPYTESQLDNVPLSAETRAFLLYPGLPENAPEFSFYLPKEEHISRRPERWGVNEDTKALLRRFVHVGFDGAGNPLCIDPQGKDAIVLLDHENGFLPELLNTSLAQFLQCLLLFRHIYHMELDQNPDWMGDDWKTRPGVRKSALTEMRRIDDACKRPNSIWKSLVTS
jgi:hypothetical protein